VQKAYGNLLSSTTCLFDHLLGVGQLTPDFLTFSEITVTGVVCGWSGVIIFVDD
jgi:hypothetical protein